jgi:hypothetical protein
MMAPFIPGIVSAPVATNIDHVAQVVTMIPLDDVRYLNQFKFMQVSEYGIVRNSCKSASRIFKKVLIAKFVESD